MKAVQVSKPRGNFEIVERPIPEPGRGQVRIMVEACGICHSDVLVKDGLWSGIQYPRVPGHEIAGRIDSIGRRHAVEARSAGGWDGTAGTAFSVTLAGAAISWPRRSLENKVTFMLPLIAVEVLDYLEPDGRSPYADWFDDLNPPAAAKVTIALARL
jgi:hypothetical protein